MPNENQARQGTCAACGATTPADDTGQSVIRGGRLLCADCVQDPVAFVAECLDCDWTYAFDDTEFNRTTARQRVQSQANSHETRAGFDGASHETVWRECDPADALSENTEEPER